MEAFPEHPDKEEIERCAAVQEKYREEGGYELEARICRELYRMGLPEELLDRDFRVLSGGEKSKLLMLALFLRPNAFVLLDEPTNHLDIRGKQAIAHYLKQKKGFLAVSHDRQFLDETADHILRCICIRIRMGAERIRTCRCCSLKSLPSDMTAYPYSIIFPWRFSVGNGYGLEVPMAAGRVPCCG